jgi:hypothetical protein
VIFGSDDFTAVGPEGQAGLGFQRVADHTAPAWPSSVKQFHLDFRVQDLEAAEQQLLELGATRPEHQPDAEKWRVLTDPAGHQFCIAVFG